MKETRGKTDYHKRKNRDPKFLEKKRKYEREIYAKRAAKKRAAGIDPEKLGYTKWKVPPEVEQHNEKMKEFYKAKILFYQSPEGKKQDERLRCLEYQYRMLCHEKYMGEKYPEGLRHGH
jgi:hypothetical protein